MKCPKCQAENPDTKQFCGDCGTKLEIRIRGHVPDSPESGTCPQNSEAKSPLSPEIPSPGVKDQASVTRTLETTVDELARGTLFAGRYEIIEELGAGGMGKVYRAFDRKIEEEVALKLLKPEIAADKKTVDRFRNELKLARKIRHSNICGMFDLGEEGKTLFISMEYVRGEDLRSFIRRAKQLNVATAVAIAGQIAEGLSEAHKLGITHRDLKPGNIMIDKEGNAKIMDFGIARSLAGAGTTVEGAVIGTPEYMSPEQVEGRPADQRADIYALGVILFEMVTGRPPFDGETALAVAHKHKYEPAPDPQDLNPQLPLSLGRLILRCLEKEREKRYQTAEGFLADLQAVEAALPTADRLVPKRKPSISREITVKFTLRRLFVPGLAVIGVIIAALLIWKVVLKKPIALLPEQKRSIAVISFENQTGDPAFDYLSKVIPNLLITNLEQCGYFSVTTWERLYDLLKQVSKPDAEFIGRDLGFELCQKDAVEVIVLGSVTKAGNTFVTDAKVLEVGTKKLLGTVNSRGDNPDSILKTQVDDLSRQIAKRAGISERKVAAARMQIEGITASSLEAYNFYIKGQEELLKKHGFQAMQCFEKAVELDPNFAMALLAMGGESITKAMALSRNVSEKERLYIEARYAREIENDRPKAISLYRQLVDKYPKEKEAFISLGGLAQNPQEQIEMFRKALEIDPYYARLWDIMGYRFLTDKEYEKAVEAFQKYVSVRPGEPNPIDSLADAYFQWGRLDEALELYKKSLQIDPGFYMSLLAIGYIYALKEDYHEAHEWIDKAMGIAVGYQEENAYVCLWKAFYFAWLGSQEKSLEYVQMAENAYRDLRDETGKAHGDRLKACFYYDRDELELSRRHNESSILALIKNEPNMESVNRVSYDFLSGLIDVEEGKVGSAKSRLTEMDSLLADIGGFPKDLARFESEWLRAMILLYEKSFEEAFAAFEKAAALKFAPNWTFFDTWKFRYNTPFQRDKLAQVFVERGELGRAIAEYAKLMTFDAKVPSSRALIHPIYHFRLGKLYEKKGLKEEAKAQYQRFLDLWKDADPGRPEVEDAKKRLAGLTS